MSLPDLTNQAQLVLKKLSLPTADLSAEDQKCLSRVLVLSEFVAELLKKHPEWLPWLVEQQHKTSDLENELSELLATIDEESDAMRVLRQWRNRHQSLIIWKDLNRQANTRQITSEITALAEAAIRCTLHWLQPKLEQRFGQPQPCPHSGQPQQLSVIAMGKCGASELNLSSDVDLIFAFPKEGETQPVPDSGSDKTLSHSDFFIRLGRKLIQLLDTHTADGFVFRVDMRLRPWGQSGPLATTFNFLHKYYQEQGRDWERFAMIKARVVSGSTEAASYLHDMFRGFVFRRYVDFHALQALREMKRMILQENRRQGRENNIKLGQGGIREIEFMVQALQLIRGGQDNRLQVRNIWSLWPVIQEEGLLPDTVVAELSADYDRLRDIEHALQAWQDRQTQTLPEDEAGRQRLAWAMGHSDIESFTQDLEQVRARVSHHFDQFIEPESEQQQSELDYWQALWAGEQTPDAEHQELMEQVSRFRESNAVQKMQPESRQRLDRFMPPLLAELDPFKEPMAVWQKTQPLLEAVLRRSSYLLLLTENPSALKLMLKLISLSPWVAEQLTEKPYLLDELTDQHALFSLPGKLALEDELHRRLLRLPEEDLEQQMEVLRHFRHGRVLRAAACELTEALPLMKISDYLCHIAETIVDQSFWLAWQQLTRKHGRPMKTKEEPCNPDFGVIGYGKTGGLELSYESDLDLVFIHNGHNQLSTEGPKQIDNQLFFARLGQKLIHLMSTLTPSGWLYEVDMRLRPSGNKGLLVSSLRAFEKYHLEEAWTWEHQALVRARFIAGDLQVKNLFEEIRHTVLCRSRDVDKLQQEVRDMRQKMRNHLATPADRAETDQLFNLKQDSGGIVDIEFMVQYAVLAWAQYYPQLTRWTDNVRLIDSLREVGFFTEQQAQGLLDAYLAYRARSHRCMLQKQSTTLQGSEELAALAGHREQVTATWQQIMEASPSQPEN